MWVRENIHVSNKREHEESFSASPKMFQHLGRQSFPKFSFGGELSAGPNPVCRGDITWRAWSYPVGSG